MSRVTLNESPVLLNCFIIKKNAIYFIELTILLNKVLLIEARLNKQSSIASYLMGDFKGRVWLALTLVAYFFIDKMPTN